MAEGINYKGFLKPTVLEIVEERVISNRFVDEEGKPIPFKVKAISQEENDALIEKYTKKVKIKNGHKRELDNSRYGSALVVACCVQPDFNGADICKAYGVINPIDVPKKMLLAGEFAKLTNFVMEVNNFQDDEELIEEAKNS